MMVAISETRPRILIASSSGSLAIKSGLVCCTNGAPRPQGVYGRVSGRKPLMLHRGIFSYISFNWDVSESDEYTYDAFGGVR